MEVAEDLVRVALRCVEADAAVRPHMMWVVRKVSKIFLNSKISDGGKKRRDGTLLLRC